MANKRAKSHLRSSATSYSDQLRRRANKVKEGSPLYPKAGVNKKTPLKGSSPPRRKIKGK